MFSLCCCGQIIHFGVRKISWKLVVIASVKKEIRQNFNKITNINIPVSLNLKCPVLSTQAVFLLFSQLRYKLTSLFTSRPCQTFNHMKVRKRAIADTRLHKSIDKHYSKTKSEWERKNKINLDWLCVYKAHSNVDQRNFALVSS